VFHFVKFPRLYNPFNKGSKSPCNYHCYYYDRSYQFHCYYYII